jgi:hypothetical protein
MDLFSILLVVLGLCLFEIINSVDNVVLDAEVLRRVRPRSRRLFLFFDMVFAVLIVRGLLPWFVVFLTIPSFGLVGSFVASFSSDPVVLEAFEIQMPFLLVGSGTFFVLLFLDWFFRKPKNFSHYYERYFHGKDEFFHFFAVAVIIFLCFISFLLNYFLFLPIFVGSTVFFVLHGLRSRFHEHRKSIAFGKHKSLSDSNKLVYLELMDSVFSIDSVLGAFAFTFSLPLIMLGAGLGAFLVRIVALGNIEKIRRYAYLRNGAMYSILVLGIIMICESFGFDFPFWISTLMTFIIIGLFFVKSHKEIKLFEKVLPQTKI